MEPNSEDLRTILERFEYTTREVNNTLGGDIGNTDCFIDKFQALDETNELLRKTKEKNIDAGKVFTEANLGIIIEKGHMHDEIINAHGKNQYPAKSFIDIFGELAINRKIKANTVFTESIFIKTLDNWNIIGYGDVKGHIMFWVHNYNEVHRYLLGWYDKLMEVNILDPGLILTNNVLYELLKKILRSFTTGKTHNQQESNKKLNKDFLYALNLFRKYKSSINSILPDKHYATLDKYYYHTSRPSLLYSREYKKEWRTVKKALVDIRKISNNLAKDLSKPN